MNGVMKSVLKKLHATVSVVLTHSGLVSVSYIRKQIESSLVHIIAWTNIDLLSIDPSETDSSKNEINTNKNASTNVFPQMAASLFWLQCRVRVNCESVPPSL